MAYLKKISKAKNIVLIEKYHTYRFGRKGVPRSTNTKPTPEIQKKINARHASKNRMLTICENFEPGALFIRLSYFWGMRPEDINAAHKNLCALFRKIKRKYKDLIYAGVTEEGSKGGLHHHILVPADFDLNLLNSLWVGGINIKSTYTSDLSQVASYFTKGECNDMLENPMADKSVNKKYTMSRNMKKPQVKVKVIKADHWTDYPRSSKIGGVVYDIKKDSVYSGVTADGYAYQRYIMVARPDSTNDRKDRNGKQRFTKKRFRL